MTQIKLRRDTSTAFASSNPILGNGEPAYETDTKKLKIGDGTTAYTQLEYFSAGGGGPTNISATLPLKIVDGVISLEVDGQTIQIVDGKLHANLDDKQDKFETQAPLSISGNPITTSVPAGITETEKSWSGGGLDKLITVDVSALNIDANSDWKIHLSGYMGNYHTTTDNTNALLITTENETIFRVWFGTRDFRLGNGTSRFYKIPNTDREFYYEIAHQKNGTEFTFNGGNLVDINPLPIQAMFEALGSGNYTTLKGKGKLKDFSFLINIYQFQRIDKGISKSYFEANGVKYPITSVGGTNKLSLNIGSGLSVVGGKLTASSTAPANMATTDTNQTITGVKTFGDGKIILDGWINTPQNKAILKGGRLNEVYLGDGTGSTAIQGDIALYPTTQVKYKNTDDVFLHTANLGNYVDGTTITYTNKKLSATGGGSAPTNMVTTDTAQTITGIKTFENKIVFNKPVDDAAEQTTIYGGEFKLGTSKYDNSIYANQLLLNANTTNAGTFKVQTFSTHFTQINGATITSQRTGTGAYKIINTIRPSGNSSNKNYSVLYSEVDDNYNHKLTINNLSSDLVLAGKTIKDGSGNEFLTSGDKETIMGYIMPDYSTRTEVPWNTDNTAPTDGYVEVFGEGDGSTSAFVLEYTINGVKTAVSSCYATSRNTNFRLPVICPKGTVYRATGGAVGHNLHFISMKGAV